MALGQSRYHAKIVSEDGTAWAETPQIIPGMSERLVQACAIVTIFGNGTVEYVVNWRARTQYDPQTADACPVTIRARGFRPMSATLREGGVVVMKRIGGDHEGSTISRTALEAPQDARKAYEKGVGAVEKKKWAAAQKSFERAVEIYPDYAQAWSGLGEVLNESSKPDEARAAWEHAVKADPKYMRPYMQLARLDLQEKKPEDAAAITDKALALNSVEFPGLYFYNAVAHFNLGQLDQAEKSARRAISLDHDHEVPRAEDLLGNILAARGDRAGALEHMRNYLALAPKAGDADTVKQRIADLEAKK